MLHSTRGIVFHSTRYAETSLIVKIYTALFGLQSYLVRGVRNPKSKIKPGLFQPLTLLDLVVYHKERNSLQSVKEIRLAHPYQSIPYDIRKSSVVLFMNELVYKSIKEEEPNPSLFEFLWGACLELDGTSNPVSNFHIWVALQLCNHLGIFPQSNYSSRFPIFNLREGMFQPAIPEHPHYLDQRSSLLLHSLLESCRSGPYQSSEKLIKPDERNHILETILLYYQLHLPGFKGLQSHHILHTVLS